MIPQIPVNLALALTEYRPDLRTDWRPGPGIPALRQGDVFRTLLQHGPHLGTGP